MGKMRLRAVHHACVLSKSITKGENMANVRANSGGAIHPYTSRTSGFDGSTALNAIGAWPKMPMTAGSLPPFFTPS